MKVEVMKRPVAGSSNSSTFEEGLQAQWDAGTINKRSVFGRQVNRVLTSNNANRKKRGLDRMEAHARVHLGIAPDKAVNWTATTIDWASLLALLAKLLPFILALFGL